MHWRCSAFTLCVFAVLVAPARAQVPILARQGEHPPLTLQAAVEEALEKNPALLALARAAGAAATRPAQERALMPPMLEGQIWQWPINTFDPSKVNMYMFSISQELPGRGKRDLRATLMDTEARMSLAEIGVKSRQVIGEVKRTYAELFLARKSIAIVQSNLDLLRQFTDISQAKYAAGNISQQDVLKPIVEISRLHEELLELKEKARMAEAELNVLLDRPADQTIGALAEPLEEAPLPPVAELQARAVEVHPELKTARLAVERGEAALAVTSSDYKPDFRVGGGYMLMPEMRDAWMASFAVTWPKAPWSRRGIDARMTTAQAEIEEARARVRTIESAVRLAVQQAYVRVESAAERATLLRTTLMPQSAQVLEVARLGYQTDRADFLDLLDSQRVLLMIQLDYWRALVDLEQARADLERAVGLDIEEASGRLMPAPASNGRQR